MDVNTHVDVMLALAVADQVNLWWHFKGAWGHSTREEFVGIVEKSQIEITGSGR
jgi:hypothetical protein